MNEQYFKGVVAAYLGASFIGGPVYEWQIEAIKESLSHYCEAQIDHSQSTPQEKEDQKRQMEKNLDAYIQGMKDEMKTERGLPKNT